MGIRLGQGQIPALQQERQARRPPAPYRDFTLDRKLNFRGPPVFSPPFFLFPTE